MRSYRFAFIASLTIAFLALAPGAALAFDYSAGSGGPLEAKEFFKPELYLSTSNVPAASVLEALPNKASWDRFLAAQGKDAVVYFDPRSGTPSSVVLSVPLVPGNGQGNRLNVESLGRQLGYPVHKIDGRVVGDAFLEFLRSNQEALGIDLTQMGPVRAEPSGSDLWHVSIPQWVGGIPVRYGRIAAAISHGNLVVLGTEHWGNVRIDTTPRITGDQALEIGFVFAGGKASDDAMWKKPTLEIVPVAPQQFQQGEAFVGPIGSGYGHRLVWAFGFQRKGEAATWEVLVDAASGEVLAFEDRNQYETKKISGGVYPLTSTEVCPSNDRCGVMQPDEPMPWANTGLSAPNDFTNSAGLFNYPGSGNVTTSLSGKYVRIIDTCGAVSETAAGDIDLGGVNGQHDCTTSGASAGDTPASRSAFYEVNKLVESARGWLPGNAWLSQQLPTTVNIVSTCNAYYSAGTINFYRSGGGCRNTGEIAAVFDHEWGHALDDNDTGGNLSNTSEAYADVASIYRLQASCVGYGFLWTSDRGCGQTADGTGFNSNEHQNGGSHCDLDCSGVRDADWDKHSDHTPDTPLNFVCPACLSGSGPCGRQVHCSAAPPRQAAWDLVVRDLTAAPFNMTVNDAFILGNRLFYQGSGNIGDWYSCSCGSSSDGCGAAGAYLQWLAADDDDGNLSNGTPHMTALYAAFNRHGIACATPTPQIGGCAGGPASAPTLSVSPGSNQIVLSWTAVPGAARYRVLRSEGYAGCDFGKTVIAEIPGTSYTDPDVANGRPYSYVVQAVGGSGSCAGPSSACETRSPQPCAGSVSIDRTIYNCSSTLGITLVDSDLIGQGSHAVLVWSGTEPTPETVLLPETPAGSGRFEATFPVTTLPASNGDGALSVADGDTITFRYTDASYCGTPNVDVDRTAAVDCVGPVITNVQAINITGKSADLVFTTNEPTDTVVRYGAVAPPGTVLSDATLVTSHLIHVGGLSPCTNYVFSVEGTDAAGNFASDDNGGQYYEFLTSGLATRTHASASPPVSIPDNVPTGAVMTLAVPDNAVLSDVNIDLSITHSFDGDLVLSLIGPDNTAVILSNRRGSGGDNFTNTVFDDQATTPIASGTAPFTGSFRPDQPLSGFEGKNTQGTWTLKVVDAAGVDTGTIDRFQLTFEVPEPCPTVGQVALDKTSYLCSDLVQVQVVDFSLQGAGTQAVTLASTTEAVPETLVLVETPPSSATFVGSIPLSTNPPTNGDGLLSVSDGDAITVTYIDADDGYGQTNVPRIDTAVVDCSGPVIANVAATTPTGRTALVTFDTNEAGNSVVVYGASVPPGTPATSATLVTAHSVALQGLVPCTTYYYLVRTTDATGNTAVDDNGGAYYTFTTPVDNQPVYLFSGPAISIPDNDPTGISVPIVVADAKQVLDLNVRLNVAHANVGDLEVVLTGPTGTSIPLVLRRGGAGDNFVNTVLDDEAATSISAGTAPFTGSFRPEQPLSAFDGTFADGTWTLTVSDRVALTSGTLNSFALEFTFPAIPCGAPSVQKRSFSVADSCGSGGGFGGDSVVDPGEDLSIPVQLVNSGNGAATAVTATLTTSTPDVTIVDGSAAYGNLAVAQSAFGDAPFLVYVGDTVPCGTVIAFQLNVASSEGAWTDSFTVRSGAPVFFQNTYNSADTPKPIPDVRTPPVTSGIAVADTGVVGDVNVLLNLTHTYDGDLDIFLIGPNGVRVELSTDNGGTGENFTNTVFDDQAATAITAGTPPYTGSFRPEGSLATLNGIPANGTWTLEITDDAGGDSGVLLGWSLIVTTPGGYSCHACAPTMPGEVARMDFTAKNAASWTSTARASEYRVYRGADIELPKLMTADVESCLRATTAGLSMSGIAEEPASGSFLWWLVRAANLAGEGTAGSATAGPRIHDSGGNCP